jgi:hypothetical protein
MRTHVNIHVHSNRIRCEIVLRGDKNEMEPIFIANFYGLFLVLDVNEISIWQCVNMVLKLPTITIGEYEWGTLLCTKYIFFFYFNQLRIVVVVVQHKPCSAEQICCCWILFKLCTMKFSKNLAKLLINQIVHRVCVTGSATPSKEILNISINVKLFLWTLII